jgi:hypothetical protein
MNQTQRSYLISRINGVHRAKQAEFKTKCTVKGKNLNNRERWRLIVSNKVKALKAPEGIDKRYSTFTLTDLFDFSAYEDKVDQKKLNAIENKLSKEVRRTTDLAMLGDCEKAVRLIDALESFTGD